MNMTLIQKFASLVGLVTFGDRKSGFNIFVSFSVKENNGPDI